MSKREVETLKKRIAELEAKETKLREYKTRYRAFLSGFDGLVYISSQDYQIEFINNKFITKIGRNCTGESCYKALYGFDTICPWCIHERVLKGETVRYEFRGPKGNSWYYGVNNPIFKKDGRVSNHAMVTDITEQKINEQALKNAHNIISKSPIVVFRWKNLEGWPVEYVTDNVKAVFGYSADDFISGEISYSDVVHPGDLERVGWEVSSYGADKSCEKFEHEPYRAVRKDGRIIWLDDKTHIQRNAKGEITHYQGIVEDITDRKKAEEKYQITRFSIEQASIGYLMATVDAKILDVNEYVCKYLGYTHKELCSMTVLDINPSISPERWMKLWEVVKDQGINTIETNHRRKDGTSVPIAVTANHFEFQGNQYVISFYQDITELKKAQKDKEDLQKRLVMAQKVEAIGRLAGGVAHDLNNMLTPIMGYSEVLLGEFSPKDKRSEYVKQILTASDNARDLVHKLLAFGRKQTLEYTQVNLNEAIKRFEKLLRRTIREDIDLQIHTSPNVENIKADIGQIEQIIMNLCINAQDAMPDGGKLIVETNMVKLDADYSNRHFSKRTGKYVMLAVSDTGCGIDESLQQQIFEPFFTTKGELGTGLGLATVYGIVKQHDGDIWVYSEPGNGTTFKIYLPVDEEQYVQTKTDTVQVDKLTGSETIMIVEDNETVRNLTGTMLSKQGYTIFSASNGAEALEIVDSQKCSVDLLLTDVVMPDMNGKELYSKFSKKCPGVKVLYMSGYTNNVIAHRGILDEGIHFIQKPFSIQGLSKKVREAMEK
ncbi:MAG: PAS domain S-box protein [Deltaproteobacteria bacterium]|nr:PAS domain S-box protein [Deltaproteobacteria bacterium]